MYINWIPTASFVALNRRLVKNVFRLHYRQYKIETALVYKVFCFPTWSNRPFLKKIKVVSIEHEKQKLILENN